MSIGRSHVTKPDTIRDVEAEFLKALLAEYEAYKSAGRNDRAEAVAAELRRLGHEVGAPRKAPAKETAVSPEPLEKAVEDAPKRRGRPRNTDPK